MTRFQRSKTLKIPTFHYTVRRSPSSEQATVGSKEHLRYFSCDLLSLGIRQFQCLISTSKLSNTN